MNELWFRRFERRHFFDFIDDKTFLMMKYKALFGKKLDLVSPRSFNEKMQWLKLYDRNPRYTELVDKNNVKKYVENLIGAEYVIPTLGIWEKSKDIDWEYLPQKFVLKVTHDSGGLVICKDKNKLDKKAACAKLQSALKRDYYKLHREWPYKDVHRCIIAEKYIQNDDSEELTDYKFMCFNGKVKCIFTGTGRYSVEGLKITFYDPNWNILPFKRHYPAEKKPTAKPKSLNEMISLAEKLSSNIPFVRVDFYEVNSRPLFGEMTFFPGSGFEEFQPEEWDNTLGDWINLPSKDYKNGKA